MKVFWWLIMLLGGIVAACSVQWVNDRPIFHPGVIIGTLILLGGYAMYRVARDGKLM